MGLFTSKREIPPTPKYCPTSKARAADGFGGEHRAWGDTPTELGALPAGRTPKNVKNASRAERRRRPAKAKPYLGDLDTFSQTRFLFFSSVFPFFFSFQIF